MERRPIFVGIAGGTASGKTSVCDIVFEKIGVQECTLLPMDCFYVELTDEEYEQVGSYNFDHPNAMDWPLIRETFGKLLSGQDVVVPNYNYKTCKRDPPGLNIKCTEIILFEGIFALFDSQLRDQMDLKIFVHSDDDIRLLRRLKRDVLTRGRTVEGVIKSYNRFVKAAYDEYIKPTMKHSDIIIPRGKENTIAIDFVAENLKNRLKVRQVKEMQKDKVEEEEKKSEYICLDQVIQRDASSKGDLIDKIIESITAPHITDTSLLPLHFQYLSKSLLDLFTGTHPSREVCHFLNKSEALWTPLADLQSSMESLADPDSCHVLCLFLPELVHPESPVMRNLIQLVNTIRQFEFVFSDLQEIAIVTPFLSPKIVDAMRSQELNSGMIKYYTLKCSQEFSEAQCFYRGQSDPNEVDEKIRIEEDRMWKDAQMFRAFYNHFDAQLNQK